MIQKALKVLLVEDDPGDARLLHEMFREQDLLDLELTRVECMSEAEEYLLGHEVDVALLDLGLPDAQGLAAVRRARQVASSVALVVLTGLDDEVLAARALQNGAQDYLIKGEIDARGLLRALRYAVERNSLEAALFAEKERAQVTLDSIGDAVMCTDISGRVSFLNAVAEKVTGWSLADATGRPVAEVFRIRDARGQQAGRNPMEVALERDRAGHLPPDSVLIRRDGSEVPIEDSVAPIHDRERRATGAVIVFRDVSAAVALAVQMTHAAQHDFLTGLPNRMLLNDRVGSAISLAQRHVKKVAVLFLDLDGFKHINDSLGHQIGDKLLQSIALRLVGSLRGSDTVSRQGGDEFVMLLSEVELAEEAATAASRLLKEVAEAHLIDEHDLHVTTSIGVSIYPDDGLDAETLIKNADTAMYQAKENGRHCVQFFEPAMNVRAVERQFIEEGLRRALERQEFVLHYQPRVDLKTGVITGAEALLRWMHPTRGLVPPSQFIPVAEDCGLILPIGKWVLLETCKQAKAWLDAGFSLGTVAVNISGVELRDPGFVAGVFATLDATGLDPRSLELELTESVLMGRTESTEAILRTLRKRGIQLAVDDFGTGYSSLSYLRRFSIDSLKIDQSFVRQITTAPDETTIVAAVIGMGRNLNLRVVAEGVETQDELLFLQAQQCDEAQGYLFSQPLPAARFAELLAASGSRAVFDSFEPAGSEARAHPMSGVMPIARQRRRSGSSPPRQGAPALARDVRDVRDVTVSRELLACGAALETARTCSRGSG